MIRRTQAEALLKLAEALEECERNGVEILWDNDRDRNGVWANQDFTPFYQDGADGAAVRMAIAKLYPKSED